MRRFLWILILLLTFPTSSSTAADATTQPTLFERFARLTPRVFRDHVRPNWFANGTKFWYRNDLANGEKEFILVDAAAGRRTPAFDSGRVAAAIGVDAKHLPVEGLRFDDDLAWVILQGRGQAWKLDLRTYELTPQSPEALASPADALPPTLRPRPSRRTGDPTTITFLNHTADPVDVFWMDTEGHRQHYATVAAGSSWDSNTYDGHVWLVTGKDDRTLGVFEARAEASTAVVGDAPATQASTRPAANRTRRQGGAGANSLDGQWAAFVRDHNLFIRDKNGGEEIQLSEDGKAGDSYSPGEIWWSPDSKKVVAMRTEPGQEHKIYEVESSPADQVQPELRTLDYLKPGDRIAHPHPELFDVAAKKHVATDEKLFPNPWTIEDVRWAADSSRFTFVYNQRGHQILRIISVDASSGEAKPIVDEQSKTFIDYSGKYFCHWVNDDELIWMSERDGWNHLWLYDAKKGTVKNEITAGEWVVQDVMNVDDEKRQVWFHAGGVRPGQDPYYTHFCRVNFDGTDLKILTEGDGNHAVQWTPGDAYFLDTWSRIDKPPVTELRSSESGKLICPLEEADGSEALAARGGRWPERFVAKGRDGTTDIYGMILFPRNFDPGKKYPVLEDIYAGPQGFFTPKGFRVRYGAAQDLADRGMIVVQCDGMGTSGRSKAFHDVCYKNLKDAGFPDRIAWIKAAAAQHPQMDLSRVGIYGGSAGGQNAMAALLWHNDFYKVAVADCGCHDNRMDKIWWNEQWMGWPVDQSYEESSNVVNAHLLQGKLMLIVGELDSNVDPASTMQVVNALEKANKDFELLIVTGANHGAGETPYGSKRRAEFLTENLVGAGS
jgi:dipeptidyl-peptidase 4